MKYGTLVRIPEGCNLSEVCESKFSGMAKCGMNACQLIYKPAVYNLEDADIIRESAKKHGIEISAQFCGFYDSYMLWDVHFDFTLQGINSPIFGESRMKYLLSAIPFLKRLGVSDMVIHAGYIPNNPFENSYATMLACVRLLGGELQKNQMNLLFETGGESPITMLRLIQDSGLDNLFVNLDTANLILYGFGNPVDALYTYGKYVRNVHAKDGMPPQEPGCCGKEVPIGTGYVDFEKVIKNLAELGYDRHIIIEREIVGGDQDAEILKALTYIKSLVEKYYI